MNKVKLRCKKDFSIIIDETYGTLAYVYARDEFDAYPTNDGMRFEVAGKQISPYDCIEFFELAE
ncbi:MAG: hypothetical protein RSF40_01450 [Oscillospiraceae bacterium]